MNGVSVNENVMTITYTATNEDEKEGCRLMTQNKFLLLNFTQNYTRNIPQFTSGSFGIYPKFEKDILTVIIEKQNI